MQGVGPGSLLGGRYLVQRRVAQHSRFERWAAADQTLDRDVVLLCFDADGPTAAAALDAARRAAGVEDHRLVRVLDVGRDESVAFVVEEPLRGARSMTAVLADGGLPAEEARRLVGESAAALEAARARGLHHGVLTPRSVLRLDGGAVKVRGLATEAALVDADDITPDAATRADTLALVALSYAALTGRWPLPGGDAGLEAAPRVPGGVAAPSEIAVGVPADLDLLARTTLNEDRGPVTPGQLAEQLAPWSPTPVTGSYASGAPRPLPGSRTEPLERDRVTGGVARPRTGGSRDGGAGGGDGGFAGLGRAGGGRAVAAGAAAGTAGAAAGTAGAAAGASGAAAARAVRPDGAPRSVLGMGVGARRLGNERGSDDTAAGDDPAYDDEDDQTGDARDTRDIRDTGRSDGRSGPKAPAVVAGAIGAVAAGAAAGGAAVAKGLGSAVGAAGGLAGAVGGRMGGLARGAADRAAERSANRAERRDTEQWEDPFVVGDVRLSDTLEPTDEQLEPPLPLLPGAAQEPLDRDQSRLALIVIAAFVVVAAALGIWGLPKLSGIGATSSSGAAPVVTQTVTSTPSGSASAAPAPSPTSSAAPTTNAPIAIAGSSQISSNAGVQAVKTTAQAYDGNPATFWRSTNWYATPAYGGIANRQVGLLLDLGSSVDVHQVAFTLVGAADVSVYVGDQQKVDGATQIGAESGQDGASTVTVPGGGSAKGRYVILWFTTLGPDGEGHYRAQVAEVSVS